MAMRIFTQKRVEPRQPVPSFFSRSSPTTATPNESHDLILRLQRKVGNRALQRILHPHSEASYRRLADTPDKVNTTATTGAQLLANDLAQFQFLGRSTSHTGLARNSSTTLMRQKSEPPTKKGDEPKPENKPADREKMKEALCVNESIDDAHARCQFTPEQSNIVRVIKDHAIRRCNRALSAINMPGNEDQVKRLARDYFNLNVKMSAKTKKAFARNIQAVADKLSQSPIECGNCQDAHCNGGAIAHVDEARTFLVLCPLFFNRDMTRLPLSPRILIHEAGHLANLDQNTSLREEFYCFQAATKDEKCPVVDAIHNVDAWSHFIEELSFTI
jgi:hypothetical protein